MDHPAVPFLVDALAEARREAEQLRIENARFRAALDMLASLREQAKIDKREGQKIWIEGIKSIVPELSQYIERIARARQAADDAEDEAEDATGPVDEQPSSFAFVLNRYRNCDGHFAFYTLGLQPRYLSMADLDAFEDVPAVVEHLRRVHGPGIYHVEIRAHDQKGKLATLATQTVQVSESTEPLPGTAEGPGETSSR